MKAAVLRQLGRLDIEDVELDGPRANELRIRVLASGLCHSDYHMIIGDLPTTLPAVLGHEAAGVIEAVGSDVAGFTPGDMVITCFSAFCGHCHECQDGHSHRCEDKPGKPTDREAGSRITRGAEAIYQLGNLSGFAEEMVVHHRSAVKMPEGMPATSAALMGCGVLTGTGAVLNAAKVEPGSSVAVIGCGGVGLNAVQGARIAGAVRIIAIDTSAEKLGLARKFGATDAVLAGPDAVGEVLELTKRRHRAGRPGDDPDRRHSRSRRRRADGRAAFGSDYLIPDVGKEGHGHAHGIGPVPDLFAQACRALSQRQPAARRAGLAADTAGTDQRGLCADGRGQGRKKRNHLLTGRAPAKFSLALLTAG
jgi:D-arabinose 1-dehydrogenase-like Zn-dependent alcohol dehydrogenase